VVRLEYWRESEVISLTNMNLLGRETAKTLQGTLRAMARGESNRMENYQDPHI